MRTNSARRPPRSISEPATGSPWRSPTWPTARRPWTSPAARSPRWAGGRPGQQRGHRHRGPDRPGRRRRPGPGRRPEPDRVDGPGPRTGRLDARPRLRPNHPDQLDFRRRQLRRLQRLQRHQGRPAGPDPINGPGTGHARGHGQRPLARPVRDPLTAVLHPDPRGPPLVHRPRPHGPPGQARGAYRPLALADLRRRPLHHHRRLPRRRWRLGGPVARSRSGAVFRKRPTILKMMGLRTPRVVLNGGP